jgi:agmatine deiminase
VLNSNRSNSKFISRTKDNINNIFTKFLGIEKVIYLPRGVFNDDDTDGHVDNLCTFARPGEVILTFPEDESSPQFQVSKEAYDILINSTDAKGRKLIIHKIPHPPLLITTKDDLEDLESYGNGSNELLRKEGTTLAASYINYYLANGDYGKGVVMPKFNVETDIKAYNVMKEIFPDREIIMVEARDILLGGGNIHCITQQQPC